MGQFFTPGAVAMFMAGMFDCRKPVISVLDPGAGIGSLSAAFILAMCQRRRHPAAITLTVYEIDPFLVGYLQETLDRCRVVCEESGISFQARVVLQDFLEAGASTFAGDLFAASEEERFDCVIVNPPYRKIHRESRERRLLQAVGLETTNLYAGFLAVAARLLAPDGEMVAITPRSFCNGPYFEAFRRFIMRELRFRRIHVFDTRDTAFADDRVLQENVIFHAAKTKDSDTDVVVSASTGPGEADLRMRSIKYDELIKPRDRHAFIHVVPDGDGEVARNRIETLGATLSDLGLTVSTGRVVDFRAKELLRAQPGPRTAPLNYPCHLQDGYIEWPNDKTRKPNALALGPGAEDLLVPKGYYVVTKRFSSKEERRRVVAAIYDPTRVSASQVAFENHLNYYHAQGSGLPVAVAKGLAAFLNSTVLDTYFRQFSGHTQVNASDLRSLRYPNWDTLDALGKRIGKRFPAQEDIDRIVEETLFRG